MLKFSTKLNEQLNRLIYGTAFSTKIKHLWLHVENGRPAVFARHAAGIFRCKPFAGRLSEAPWGWFRLKSLRLPFRKVSIAFGQPSRPAFGVAMWSHLDPQSSLQSPSFQSGSVPSRRSYLGSFRVSNGTSSGGSQSWFLQAGRRVWGVYAPCVARHASPVPARYANRYCERRAAASYGIGLA